MEEERMKKVRIEDAITDILINTEKNRKEEPAVMEKKGKYGYWLLGIGTLGLVGSILLGYNEYKNKKSESIVVEDKAAKERLSNLEKEWSEYKKKDGDEKKRLNELLSTKDNELKTSNDSYRNLLSKSNNDLQIEKNKNEELIKKNKTDQQNLLLNRLSRVNSKEEKISILEELVSLVPESEDYLVRLGNEYFAASNYNRAEELFKKATVINPKNSLAEDALSKISSLRMKDIEEYLKKTDLDRVFGVADLDMKVGKQTDAIQMVKGAIDKYPDDGLLYVIISEYYYESGNAGEGGTALEIALRYKKENAEYYKYLGKVYDNRKEFDKAVDSYQKSITLKKDAEVYDSLGWDYWKLGKIKEAKEAFMNWNENSKDVNKFDMLQTKLKRVENEKPQSLLPLEQPRSAVASDTGKKEEVVKSDTKKEGFFIEEVNDAYRLRNLEHNGIHWFSLYWSKDLLDSGKQHTQDEWVNLTKNSQWKLPDAIDYYATFAALYKNRDGSNSSIVNKMRNMFAKDFEIPTGARSILANPLKVFMTSTNVGYGFRGGGQQLPKYDLDTVIHNYGYDDQTKSMLFFRVTDGTYEYANSEIRKDSGLEDLVYHLFGTRDLEEVRSVCLWLSGKKPIIGYVPVIYQPGHFERAVVLCNSGGGLGGKLDKLFGEKNPGAFVISGGGESGLARGVRIKE